MSDNPFYERGMPTYPKYEDEPIKPLRLFNPLDYLRLKFLPELPHPAVSP